ncbi:hypothetical protein [Enterobacter asburiae]|nr:hypothetical protein [Enterobacter asburiae]
MAPLPDGAAWRLPRNVSGETPCACQATTGAHEHVNVAVTTGGFQL